MKQDMNLQVKEGHYVKFKYNTLSRFISYYYQLDSLVRYGGKKILEVGVGSKIVADILKNNNVEVKTCDFDASTKPDIIADVRNIPVEEKSYDSIAAFQVLEHIPFEDFLKVLKQFSRIARHHVIISLPYRSTYFEWVLKFPAIRTLLKREFVDITLRLPLRFGGFKTSGQHYWEIDLHQYSIGKVRKAMREYFIIKEEFSPVFNKFHRFFILEVKKIG